MTRSVSILTRALRGPDWAPTAAGRASSEVVKERRESGIVRSRLGRCKRLRELWILCWAGGEVKVHEKTLRQESFEQLDLVLSLGLLCLAGLAPDHPQNVDIPERLAGDEDALIIRERVGRDEGETVGVDLQEVVGQNSLHQVAILKQHPDPQALHLGPRMENF